MTQRNSVKVGCSAVLLAVLAGGAAAQPPLEQRQFAVGWPLELPAARGYFDIPLTLDVYQHAPSIEQLAVLDAAGEPMPFYRVAAPAPATNELRTILPASPLYVAQAPDAVAQLSVATGDGRTNVTVTQPDGAVTDIVAFVVDARGVAAAPFAIELDWRALPQPFLLDARIEQSTDLTSWRAVGRASVAALSVGGAEIRHSRVPVAAGVGGYYRVTWSRSVPDWYLQNATLLTSEAPPVPLESARFRPLASDAVEREADASGPAPLYFDAGGPLPVTSVVLDFTADNGWVKTQVAVSGSLDGPWNALSYDALFYELDYAGERLMSTPLEVGRREARYWRFTPAQALASDRVDLELRYPRESLRFSATGVAPYLLAAGTLAAEAGPDPTFADVWRQLRPPDEVLPQAALGARHDLGGAAALVVPAIFPWRSVVLWAVLGVGVVAVAWMAVRLAREMHDQPS